MKARLLCSPRVAKDGFALKHRQVEPKKRYE